MSTDKGIRVVIAEDDVLVGEMVRGILEAGGYVVVGIAANGRRAIEMTQELKPDLLLTDIQMPDMDGIEAARNIQVHCPTPVVVLTAYETPELVERASQVGVGAYLLKPPDIREVERAITIAMARFADMMELRKLNADLDAYAHTVAHDLKNPLSGLVSAADYLVQEGDNVPREDMSQYLQIIARSAHTMNDIIDDLLLMAEARGMEVRLEPLDMGYIVAEARKSLAWMIEEYHAQLDIPAEWPTSMGHASWVEGVWVNYLSNAIKYGGRPPSLELGGSVQPDGMTRFWVADNGPGIPVEQQTAIFDPFKQLDSKRVGGHGLGLSIVQRIIEKLGGKVGVESEAGKGSTFYFTLPSSWKYIKMNVQF